jgi:hypothetical protein
VAAASFPIVATILVRRTFMTQADAVARGNAPQPRYAACSPS